jgi:hypothetical protein
MGSYDEAINGFLAGRDPKPDVVAYRQPGRVKTGLSACSVGSVTAGAAHELEGLVHALFHAGAATVLAARWPVLYETATSVFCGAIRSSLYSSVPLSTALH